MPISKVGLDKALEIFLEYRLQKKRLPISCSDRLETKFLVSSSFSNIGSDRKNRRLCLVFVSFCLIFVPFSSHLRRIFQSLSIFWRIFSRTNFGGAPRRWILICLEVNHSLQNIYFSFTKNIPSCLSEWGIFNSEERKTKKRLNEKAKMVMRFIPP